jgi:hypothetical protein
VTKQIKTIGERLGLSWLNTRTVFRYCVFFPIAVLSVVILQFPLIGQAQGNLVDLYNWSNETVVGSDPNPNDYVHLGSATSAFFHGGYTDQGGGVTPVIFGSLNTVPGATYEISFTMQNQNSFFGSASLWFGSESTSFQLPVTQVNGGQGYADMPVNIDFTAVAGSTVTSMFFQCYLDPDGGSAALNHFMVTEVPEVSSSSLIFGGACVFLVANRLRKVTQKQKLAVQPIA